MRLQIPHLLDILLVDDPQHIRWLNEHPDIIRPLDSNVSLLHRLINRRVLSDLRFDTGVLPVFQARQEVDRARQQAELRDALDDLKLSPNDAVEALGAYVARVAAPRVPAASAAATTAISVIVQQWVGRLFSERYRADASTAAAAELVAQWPSAPPWRALLHRARGQLAAAKKSLATAAANDLHCIHATSIGAHNIERSVQRLHKLATPANLEALAPDEAMRRCLTVPPVLLRGCERDISVPFLSRPLTQRSIVVFLLASAYRNSNDVDDAFLDGTWSACPAHQAVPDMLKAVWQAARDAKEAEDGSLSKLVDPARKMVRDFAVSVGVAALKNPLASKAGNGWSRIWN